MHQLLLLRHARSVGGDATTSDRDRPLDPRGRRAAAAMRREMRDHGLIPDLILVSSAKRTLETLDALEPWDDTPLIEPMDELYLATETRLLEAIHAVAETVRSLLLIGHNPGLLNLAVTLADRRTSAAPPLKAIQDGFPTTALAEFSVLGPWSRLGAEGGRLIRFVTPAHLDLPH